MKMKRLIIALGFIVVCHAKSAEVYSWECGKFEGAKIIGEGGIYLGVL